MAKHKKPQDNSEAIEEAKRLATLPRDVQQQALAIIRAPSLDRKLNRADRKAAKDRADTIDRLLRRLNRRKRS